MHQGTSTRSFWSAALLAVGLIGATWLWTASVPARSAVAADDPSRDAVHGTFGLGQRIAGTYVWFVDGAQQHMNIRADGTLDWYGSWFFGDGTGAFLDAPVYGTWSATGAREITTVEIGMLYDGDGVFEATGRVFQVFSFSPDYQTIDIAGYEEILLPDQNPTDPDAEIVDSFEFTYSMSRLNHMD
jgi:hypothetical protein